MPKKLLTKPVIHDAARKMGMTLRDTRPLLILATGLGQWTCDTPDRRTRFDMEAIDRMAICLAELPRIKRREVVRRYILLLAWETVIQSGRSLGFKVDQITQRFLSELAAREGVAPCRSTLFNWRRSLTEAAGNLAALVDRRGQLKAAG